MQRPSRHQLTRANTLINRTLAPIQSSAKGIEINRALAHASSARLRVGGTPYNARPIAPVVMVAPIAGPTVGGWITHNWELVLELLYQRPDRYRAFFATSQPTRCTLPNVGLEYVHRALRGRPV